MRASFECACHDANNTDANCVCNTSTHVHINDVCTSCVGRTGSDGTRSTTDTSACNCSTAGHVFNKSTGICEAP